MAGNESYLLARLIISNRWSVELLMQRSGKTDVSDQKIQEDFLEDTIEKYIIGQHL